MRFLKVVVALAIREFERRRSKLTSRERRKINYRTCMYLFMKAPRVVLRGVRLREEYILIRYKEWFGKRNRVDLQRKIFRNVNILHSM